MKFGKTVAVFSLGMAFAGVIFFLVGCAVEKNPPFGAAEIISNPPGADVVNLKDNSTLGTTPFKHVRETKIGEEEYVTVKVSKPGYEDKVISFFLGSKYDKEEDAMNNPQQVTVDLVQTK
jgi:hypothetical protein